MRTRLTQAAAQVLHYAASEARLALFLLIVEAQNIFCRQTEDVVSGPVRPTTLDWVGLDMSCHCTETLAIGALGQTTRALQLPLSAALTGWQVRFLRLRGGFGL